MEDRSNGALQLSLSFLFIHQATTPLYGAIQIYTLIPCLFINIANNIIIINIYIYLCKCGCLRMWLELYSVYKT